MTTKTPAVQALIRDLQARGVPAEWAHTGGNCYAVAVIMSEDAEILITGDDVLLADDYGSDENLDSVWTASYVHYAEGSRDLGRWELSDRAGVVAAVAECYRGRA